MTRALLALLLTLAQFPIDAAPRRRAVGHPAPVVVPEALIAAAHQAAQNAMAAGVPAVQIAVSKGGKIVYSEAFGVTDKVTGTAATPRSVMQIGSLTKQFTAAAIVRLAERGALSLDDRIEKYVPEFDPRGATITLRHLLTHTSGVPRDWIPFDMGLDLTKPVSRAMIVNGINGKPFDFAPGTSWSYSNAGFMLLGFAIESITGRSYDEFIHNEFALPFGLLDTGVCGSNNLPLPVGYGMTQTSPPMPFIHRTVLWSSGSFCSTASDLTRWAHLLATGRVVLPDSYATMITPAKLLNNSSTTYGFGLVVQKRLGQAAVWHGGAIEGYQSFLLYFSERDIAVSVVTNSFPSTAAGNPEFIGIPVAVAALDTL
jgi:CubicO group peptidase (beta-lactamase class C family)